MLFSPFRYFSAEPSLAQYGWWGFAAILMVMLDFSSFVDPSSTVISYWTFQEWWLDINAIFTVLVQPHLERVCTARAVGAALIINAQANYGCSFLVRFKRWRGKFCCVPSIYPLARV